MEVQSNHLADVTWEEGVMTIEFRSGDRYEYYDVPVGVFHELLNSSSKSEFFRESVKGQYEYSRL